MPTDVIMPQMGESIFEGTITKWLKKIGDAVEKDEPLFEISTDKVDAEIPAPVAGVLAEIRFAEGATVEVNTVVAVIGEAGRSAAAAPVARFRTQSAGCRHRRSQPQVVRRSPHRSAGGRIRSSPLARRIAKEHGLDLSQIAGTGAEGRIGKEDVLRALSQPGTPSESLPHRSAAAPQVAPQTSQRNSCRSPACAPSLPSAWSRACTSARTSTPSTKST